MIIPIGTDRPLRRPTVVNHVLVAVNVAVYVAGLVLWRMDPRLFESIRGHLVLDPQAFQWWNLVTYAFLHAGFIHALGNLVFLWVFGPNVEDRFGRLGYLAFYMMGAVVSGGLHAALDRSPVIGASGAIAAVTGAYLVLFPHTRIKVLLLFFLIGIYEIPAWWLITGQILWNIFAVGVQAGGGVAYLAHVGGYAWGISVAMLLLATGLLKRETYDLFTLSRQAARRRQFREVGYQRARAVEKGAHPDQAARARRAESALTEAVALARAEVSTRIPEDMPGAAAAYRTLLDRHGITQPVALLNRRSQYELANFLFEAGDHQTAVTAYQLFLDGYPNDAEVPMVRLMLGLINARYLNDPVRAKQEIGRALPDLPEGQRDLAKELLAELG